MTCYMDVLDADHDCDIYEIFQDPNFKEILEAVRGDSWYQKVFDELKKEW